MKFEGLLKGALPVVAGLFLFGLALNYLGSQPLIKDAKAGYTG